MGSNWNKSDGYYVEVGDRENILFPPRCIVCDKNVDGSYIKIQGNPVGYYGAWKWQFGLNPKIKVPAHIKCGHKLKRNILFRNLLLFFLAAIILIIGIYFDWNRWQIIGLILVVLILPLYWQEKNAPAFEFRLEDKIYEFRFLNKEYAREFAGLNGVSIKE